MNNKGTRSIAAIGASAVVMVGAVAVGINQDRSSLGADARSGMSTGATVTESVAPKTPPVIRATPGITDPPRCPPKTRAYPDRTLSRHRCRQRAGGDDQNGRRRAGRFGDLPDVDPKVLFETFQVWRRPQCRLIFRFSNCRLNRGRAS